MGPPVVIPPIGVDGGQLGTFCDASTVTLRYPIPDGVSTHIVPMLCAFGVQAESVHNVTTLDRSIARIIAVTGHRDFAFSSGHT